MKKNRFMSILLTLCMMLTLLPAGAMAASANVVWVGGVSLSSGEYTSDGINKTTTAPADNYAYFNNGVLTLKNFSYTGVGHEYVYRDYRNKTAIHADGDLTIVLEGANSLVAQGYAWSYGVSVHFSNLTISGSGSLKAISNSSAIFAYGLMTAGPLTSGIITIEGGTVTATGGNCGIKGANVIITGGTVTATSNSTTVGGDGAGNGGILGITGNALNSQGVVISGNAAVTATGGSTSNGSSFGIQGDNVTISDNAVVTATGGGAPAYLTMSSGIQSKIGNITIKDNATVTASGGGTINNNYSSCGIFCSESTVTMFGGSVTISDNATLTATGGQGSGSRGIYSAKLRGYSVTISDNATVIATGGQAGEASTGIFGAVNISGGVLTAVGGTTAIGRSAGISGDVNISGGTVNARGGTAMGTLYGRSVGIDGKDATIAGGTVNAIGGTAANDSYGIANYAYIGGGVTISGGTVNAVGGTASGGSYGIYIEHSGGSVGSVIPGGLTTSGGVTIARAGMADADTVCAAVYYNNIPNAYAISNVAITLTGTKIADAVGYKGSFNKLDAPAVIRSDAIYTKLEKMLPGPNGPTESMVTIRTENLTIGEGDTPATGVVIVPTGWTEREYSASPVDGLTITEDTYIVTENASALTMAEGKSISVAEGKTLLAVSLYEGTENSYGITSGAGALTLSGGGTVTAASGMTGGTSYGINGSRVRINSSIVNAFAGSGTSARALSSIPALTAAAVVAGAHNSNFVRIIPASVMPGEYGATVAPSFWDFGSRAAGYSPVAPKIFTIENTGAKNLTGLAVTLGGVNFSSFILNTDNVAETVYASVYASEGSTNTTFTVNPKPDLPVGKYNAVVQINANELTPDTVTASVYFAVTAQPVTYNIIYDANGGSVSPTSGITNADGTLANLLPVPTKDGYTFNGWYTAISGGKQITNDTVFTVNTTIYAQWTYRGRDKSSSSSSSSSETNTISPAVSIPVSGNDTVTTSASISGQTATVSMSTSQLDNVLGEGAKNVTVDVSELNNIERVVIPAEVIGQLIVAGDVSLTIKTDTATIVIDPETLGAVTNINGDLRLVAAEVMPQELTPSQQAQSGDNAIIVDLQLWKGTTHINDFGGGTATASLPYELKEGQNPENVTAWHLADDGSMTEIPCTYDPETGLATLTLNHFSLYMVGVVEQKATPAPAPAALSLTDIAGHWAETWINQLVNLDAIAGYADNTFRPDNHITRAEFVTVLAKAYKLTGSAGSEFTDVGDGHWAKPYISAAVTSGIVSGYGDGRFGPNDLITREQMAVMMGKAAKATASAEALAFTDQSRISDWAKAAVDMVTAQEIMSGYPDGSFKPQGNATRAEAATVIAQALDS